MVSTGASYMMIWNVDEHQQFLFAILPLITDDGADKSWGNGLLDEDMFLFIVLH